MDRRISRTKKAIITAYTKLLLDKKGSKINISSIARLANIDRKTFYLHYESVEELLREQCRVHIGEVMSEINNAEFSRKQMPISYFLHLMYELTEKNSNVARMMMEDDYSDYFLKIVKDELKNVIIKKYRTFFKGSLLEIEIYSDLFLTGLLTVYLNWYKGGMKTPIDELADIMEKATVYGISTIIPTNYITKKE